MKILIILGFTVFGASNLLAAENSYGNKEEAELMSILKASLVNPSPFVEKVRSAIKTAYELNDRAFGTSSQTLKNAGEKLLTITINLANIINVIKATKEPAALQNQRSLISKLALEIITLKQSLAASYATTDRQNANALLQKVTSAVTRLLGLAQDSIK